MNRVSGTAVVLAGLSLPAWVYAAPKAPTGLTAEYTAPDTVVLDWDDTPGATEYWVFRVATGAPENARAGDIIERSPMYYDKYSYAGYGYYSKFAVRTTGPAREWRFVAAVPSSAFTLSYPVYPSYSTFSEYSYRRQIAGNTYIGYASYADYGAYFVLAVDGLRNAGLPSAEAFAFQTAQVSGRLKAPDNVKVMAGPGNSYVQVSWDAVTGADLYRVLGKDSGTYNPLKPVCFQSPYGPNSQGSQGVYWRYDHYALYQVYADYAKFHHYFGDTASTSKVLYTYYGAYLGYPLYDAYVPYGVYKIVAIKTNGDVWSASSAESRVVPPGASDIAGSTGILTSTTDTLTISNVSTDVNGAACTVPANALSQNTVLTISVQSSGTAFDTALPEALSKIGSVIDFDTGSATLTATITVTLPVPAGQTPSAMRIWHWLNNAWIEETTGRVNGASTVSVTVSSLSPFVLGGPGGGGAAGGGGGGGGGCFLSGAQRP